MSTHQAVLCTDLHFWSKGTQVAFEVTSGHELHDDQRGLALGHHAQQSHLEGTQDSGEGAMVSHKDTYTQIQRHTNHTHTDSGTQARQQRGE